MSGRCISSESCVPTSDGPLAAARPANWASDVALRRTTGYGPRPRHHATWPSTPVCFRDLPGWVVSWAALRTWDSEGPLPHRVIGCSIDFRSVRCRRGVGGLPSCSCGSTAKKWLRRRSARADTGRWRTRFCPGCGWSRARRRQQPLETPKSSPRYARPVHGRRPRGSGPQFTRTASASGAERA